MSEPEGNKKLKKPNGALAWGVVIAVVLCGLVTNGTSTMINPAMTDLLAYFEAGTTWGGSLASIFSMASAILIIPLGILISKFSCRWTIILSMAFIVLGNCGAALFATTISSFYVLRVCAAVGYAGVYAAGAVMICRWFDPDKRSIPIGCWNTVAGLGSIIVLNAGSAILPNAGWQGLWMYQGLLGLVAGVLFFIIVRERPDVPVAGEEGSEKTKVTGRLLLEAFKNPVLWCGCLLIGFSGLGAKGINTFSSMIYVQTAGVDAVTANLISSVYSFGQIIAPIIGGIIYKKVSKGNRGLVLTVTITVGMLFYFCMFTFVTSEATAWVFAACAGLTGMMFMPGLYVIVADHCPSPEVTSVGFTIMMFGMFIFGMIAPILIGWIQETTGSWGDVRYLMLAMAVLGCLVGLFVWNRDKKLIAAQEEREQ